MRKNFDGFLSFACEISCRMRYFFVPLAAASCAFIPHNLATDWNRRHPEPLLTVIDYGYLLKNKLWSDG